MMYFVGNSLLDEAVIKDDFAVDSLAYFCPVCGDIWARIVASHRWHILTWCCINHSPQGVAEWGRVSGSMLNVMNSKEFVGRWAWASCIEYLPPAILHRELMVHINHVERKYNESATPSSSDPDAGQ